MMIDFTWSFVFVISGTAFALLLWEWLSQAGSLNVPWVGTKPGLLGIRLVRAKLEFTAVGHKMIELAYRKYPHSNYMVQTQDMPRLIVAPKFLPELRMLPETKLNHSEALLDKHLGTLSGVDTIRESRQHSDVCRLQLIQNLPPLIPAMADELQFAMSEKLKSCSNHEKTPIPCYSFVYAMVLSAASRAFVGPDLCRDPRWLNTVSAYLATVNSTANALRPYPMTLRPLLRPFLAPRSRIDKVLADAHEVLDSAIGERKANPDQYVDLLKFLVETSPDGEHRPIILKLLVLTSAALHTSTMAAVNCIFDLCVQLDDELSIMLQTLVALRMTGNAWSMETIKNLRLLDSFMKESMRYNQPDTLGFSRKVLSPITLSDGTLIPTGTFLNVAAGPMSRDDQFYNNANVFEGDRFFPRSEEERLAHSPVQDFAGIEKGNVAWGSGRLTCPGRWFASAMNKLIIGMFIAEYDFHLPGDPTGDGSRPETTTVNGVNIPSFTQEIEVTRRR